MWLTGLASVLRSAGLDVVEISGWQSRGHGEMTDVQTIICHHTGGLDDRSVIINGRPGLDGPLAHFWLARTGVWHVVAAGCCWHAGESRSPTYTNHHAIGVEAEATGTDPWPSVQYDSYVTGVRALADHYGVPLSHILGHKETCAPVGRKTDPNFDMAAFRARVQEGDDMPSADEIADAVAAKLGARATQVGGEKWTWDQAIGRGASYGRRIEVAVNAAADPAEVAAAVVSALPTGTGLTQAQVTQAFVDALKELGREAS